MSDEKENHIIQNNDDKKENIDGIENIEAIKTEELKRPTKFQKNIAAWLGKKAMIAAAAFFLLALGSIFLYYQKNVLPEKIYQSAATHLGEEDYDTALSEFERAQQLGSAADDTFYRIGFANEKLGRDEDALTAYAAYLEKHPEDLDANARAARLYFKLERYEEALPLLQRMYANASDDIETNRRLGQIYERADDANRAYEHYRFFVNADVRDPEALLEVSRALMKFGKFRDALSGFVRAESLLPSDDKRAFHAVNAAKNMLGWPTDAAMVVTPGESIGNMKLGTGRDEAINVWGKPLFQLDDQGYSIWTYGGTIDAPEATVYFDETGVIEIVSRNKNHRTADGLSLTNFLEPKYHDRFQRYRNDDATPPVYRFILKDGGAAFYSGADAKIVVFGGAFPLSEPFDTEWRYYWDK